jgi:hypothetical protein
MSPAGTSSERLLIAGSDCPGKRFVTSRNSTDAARDVVLGLLGAASPGTGGMLAANGNAPYDRDMLLLRTVFALLVTTLTVLLLSNGQFGAAIVVVVFGVWLRRAADAGRLPGITGRLR